MAKALSSLNDELQIELPRGSNIITVAFEAASPGDAQEVLRQLSAAYLDKHAELHRPSGQFDFFAAQAEDAGQRLADAKAALTRFSNSGGTILGEAELAFAVGKLGELRHEFRQVQINVDETRRRVVSLESQLAEASPRMTTAVRSADNPHLMMELERTRLELELKRTELLETFEPTYRLVTEVDNELAKVHEAIEAAKETPIRDETTDRDPTFEWLRGELARARTQLASLTARADSIRASVSSYESQTRQMVGRKLEQQDLERNIKQLEATHELYVGKREEARLGNALDRDKILSVSIAQPPTLPALPSRSPTMTIAAGMLLALLAGLATVLLSEFLHNTMSNTFRTTEDVQVYLDAPIVCSLPPIEDPGKALDAHG
jgi:uncharacterized protein involved in exopolysaccharide biosynthesis